MVKLQIGLIEIGGEQKLNIGIIKNLAKNKSARIAFAILAVMVVVSSIPTASAQKSMVVGVDYWSGTSSNSFFLPQIWQIPLSLRKIAFTTALGTLAN